MNVQRILTFVFGLVWFINGAICKLLNLVPRHEMIVGHILGETYAPALTKIIGIAEIGMAIWVWSRKYTKLCGISQITLILTMNVIEFTTASSLLLWGHLNILFALLYVGLLYWHYFLNQPKSA